jgi:hypothetical protein
MTHRSDVLAAAGSGARFVTALPGFLRETLDAASARLTLRQRFACRESDFVELVTNSVYDHAASPYRPLLDHIGCEQPDFAALVESEGVEGALLALAEQGVYLSVEEFKGRRAVVRGSLSFEIEVAAFRNPRARTHLMSFTSGSRGPRTPIALDLAHVRERLVDFAVAFDARGGSRWDYALWGAPGGASIVNALQFAGIGHPLVKWFSQVSLESIDARSRLGISGLHLGSRLAGVRMPRLEHVSNDEPLPIVRWLERTLAAGHVPHLYTYTTPAVRLALAAAEAGVALDGAQMMITGEPVTRTRLDVISDTGTEAVTNYGSNEAGGVIGFGCLAREEADEVHVLHDVHALVHAGEPRRGAGGLLISSIRRMAPMILLNVSLGDDAVVTKRHCGCALEEAGWSTHLHTIRSFEKLNAEGFTLLGADLVVILEDVLPAKFGGAPIHYQLLESEDADGRPRLRLLVDPIVGHVDPTAVRDAFLAAMSAALESSETENVWRRTGVLEVVRAVPRRSGPGKVLHLHVERERASAS